MALMRPGSRTDKLVWFLDIATQQAIVAEIEAEQALVAANRGLITRFEQKIQATLARIWGEAAPAADADAVVTASSGNVFTDLGFGPGEAAVMGLRADLMARLRLLVQTEGWTQAQAAEKFGIAQSRVSDLLRGEWDKFSLDMLITLAARAGRKVGLAVA